MRRLSGFTVLELMIVITIIALIAAIAIPGLLSAQRASNEGSAAASLKSVATANHDFRANDRDNDRVVNFWVRDIYCLHALCRSEDGVTAPTPTAASMLKLIEPSVAGADGDVTASQPVSAAVSVANTVGVLAPKASYVYRQFATFGSSATPYGGPGGIVAYGDSYNISRFAVMVFPTSYVTGRKIFIVNEEAVVLRSDPTSSYATTYSGGNATSTSTWSGTIDGSPFNQATPFPDNPTGTGWFKLD